MNIFTDASRVSAEFLVQSQAVHKTVKGVMVHHGQLLRTRIQAKASGRPGPNIVTGDYRRSWSMQVEDDPGRTTVTVGTNAPQGRRLEMGFVGADSLGRVYNQPPFPHVGPATDEIYPLLTTAMEAAVTGGAADARFARGKKVKPPESGHFR